MSTWFLSASCVLQVFAAAYAIHVLVRTRYPIGWGCIAAALTLMGVVRLMALSRLIAGEPVIVPDEKTILIVEITSFVMTLLMVVGVLLIDRFFQKTRLNEQRFQDFAKTSSDWLWETDADGRLTWISEDTSGTIGHLFHHIKGKTRQEISADLMEDHDWEGYEAALKSHSLIDGFEYRFRNSAGEVC